MNEMNAWYSTLNRPPLTPPSWVFSPVWTVLYITLASSVLVYYRAPSQSHVGWTSAVLIVHLITNLCWTYLFFGLRSPARALIDIVALDSSLVVLMCWFWKSSVLAGALLCPYLAWVLSATYLNYGFYNLN
ncbi:MAG: tryptophan-rich sensory protein [Armatimonadetes bacterium CG_4_10_14_3_um_filter_66_18]|nr:tryptophan-rich sensory protein [Armatimonadota bacterium]PIY48982.1 MAG: tryptophan-rich sensory protein [Armatimonadetes bacterium CG_4_10_14_3_um_filter_66_18]NCO92727.1 tryptophan-rich sensory protein [Armatimonadota bacterium]NCP31954.1 tryptophan-rich sensory protein [Armatimonadota bacterium]NCQ28026.1 tryptophan-rich sensory protein [Armatimonadota bacterium]